MALKGDYPDTIGHHVRLGMIQENEPLVIYLQEKMTYHRLLGEARGLSDEIDTLLPERHRSLAIGWLQAAKQRIAQSDLKGAYDAINCAIQELQANLLKIS